MSYGMAAALQEAVYLALTGDAVLTGLVDSHIYDAVPPGDLPGLYVSIGPEVVRDRSDKTGSGAAHDLTISVISDAAGFQSAKAAAAAVSDVLHRADLALARGHLVALNFLRATARREGTGGVRRIDLRFRALVEDV